MQSKSSLSHSQSCDSCLSLLHPCRIKMSTLEGIGDGLGGPLREAERPGLHCEEPLKHLTAQQKFLPAMGKAATGKAYWKNFIPPLTPQQIFFYILFVPSPSPKQ